MIAIKNEAGGSYGDDAPTYVPPTTPRAIPRNRLKWLRPQDAVGRVLGVNAGPAANPTADWAQIEASLFTQLRLWQRHQLSRDGALYILSTHVSPGHGSWPGTDLRAPNW